MGNWDGCVVDREEGLPFGKEAAAVVVSDAAAVGGVDGGWLSTTTQLFSRQLCGAPWHPLYGVYWQPETPPFIRWKCCTSIADV